MYGRRIVADGNGFRCVGLEFGGRRSTHSPGARIVCTREPTRKFHSMAKQLFGTDGIRGIPGKYPLDDATLERVGFALGARRIAR